MTKSQLIDIDRDLLRFVARCEPHCFAACFTFPIGRVRSFRPVPCNRVGIHSRCSSYHPRCTSHHPICRARSSHPVLSNLAGTHSMSDGDVEHKQA